MLKRNYKSILLATGILVALMIINYNCLNPVRSTQLKANSSVEKRIDPTRNGYMAALTDIMIESAKALIRPVRH